MTTSYTATSDWSRLAAEFARWLPLIAPYGDRLIEMCAPDDGMRVLDVACGTGEPGLTLAMRHPRVRVVGSDKAPAMARAAGASAGAEGLCNIRFVVASGEHLPFPDNSFDRVICRFGVMLFDDPVRGVRELHRVVRPGGCVALSVWSVPKRVRCPALTLEVLERFSDQVEWPRTFALSEPSLLARMLVAAGFRSVSEEAYDPGFTFADVAHFLERNLTGRFIEQPYQALSATRRARFVDALGAAASAHALPDGRIHLPQEALLLGGTKPPPRVRR
ncbi:MAG: methyltransferase domain-containing protein [Nitrospirae bacterium]|nr:methyltransferase domain-containing protein [Nitrospirota bacterium]